MTTPEQPGSARPTKTFYDAVGGEETFTRLVAHFYAAVRDDPILRPLYPEEDLGPAEDRLRLFLMQYWGGPDTYHRTRGHPRLRLRHQPFAIGTEQREAWLRHMGLALIELGLPPEQEAPLWDYLAAAAAAMQNRPD